MKESPARILAELGVTLTVTPEGGLGGGVLETPAHPASAMGKIEAASRLVQYIVPFRGLLECPASDSTEIVWVVAGSATTERKNSRRPLFALDLRMERDRWRSRQESQLLARAYVQLGSGYARWQEFVRKLRNDSILSGREAPNAKSAVRVRDGSR